MVLRSTDILCRVALKLGKATVHGLLDEKVPDSFELNVFSRTLLQARYSQELAQPERPERTNQVHLRREFCNAAS